MHERQQKRRIQLEGPIEFGQGLLLLSQEPVGTTKDRPDNRSGNGACRLAVIEALCNRLGGDRRKAIAQLLQLGAPSA